VHASLAGVNAGTGADASGRWSVTLPALPAGGPHTLTIEGRNTLTFKDVMVGDVWVASGQSNMEWPLAKTQSSSEATVESCTGPRLFTVTRATAASTRTDVDGGWVPCDTDTASAFSAVAFHFGRALHRTLSTPVGLIHASRGGTPAEAWI
jgi:sialate O-acetylesterase